MNPQLEDLACLYVLDQLNPGDRALFEAQLSTNSTLAALVRKIEAAMDLRRGLLGLHHSLTDATP